MRVIILCIHPPLRRAVPGVATTALIRQPPFPYCPNFSNPPVEHLVCLLATRASPDVKAAAGKLIDKAKESETLTRVGRASREALGVVYRDMQRAGEAVVAAVREAAAKAAASRATA